MNTVKKKALAKPIDLGIKTTGGGAMPSKQVEVRTQRRLVPVPLKDDRKLIQAEIRVDLHNAVSKLAKRHDMSIRHAVEFGLEYWLLQVDPVLAKSIGITGEK